MDWTPPPETPLKGVKKSHTADRSLRVLDHGIVHLVDSMPHFTGVTMFQDKLIFGPGDQRVVESARISMANLPPDVAYSLGLSIDYEKEAKRTAADNAKTLLYMHQHHHGTPFEQVRFTFYVRLPIFTARQWIRHRMGSFNETSARYSELDNVFYIPSVERMQAQSKANKQGSADALPVEVARQMQERMRRSAADDYSEYESLLADGLTRELARNVLPASIYTQWFWTVDLRNLMGFLRLRADAHAQWEIQQYAAAVWQLAKTVAPYSLSLLEREMGLQWEDDKLVVLPPMTDGL